MMMTTIPPSPPSQMNNNVASPCKSQRLFSFSASPCPSSPCPSSPFHLLSSSRHGIPFAWEEKPGVIKLHPPAGPFCPSPLHKPPYPSPNPNPNPNPSPNPSPCSSPTSRFPFYKRQRSPRKNSALSPLHDPFFMALQSIRTQAEEELMEAEKRSSESSLEETLPWRRLSISCFFGLNMRSKKNQAMSGVGRIMKHLAPICDYID